MMSWMAACPFNLFTFNAFQLFPLRNIWTHSWIITICWTDGRPWHVILKMAGCLPMSCHVMSWSSNICWCQARASICMTCNDTWRKSSKKSRAGAWHRRKHFGKGEGGTFTNDAHAHTTWTRAWLFSRFTTFPCFLGATKWRLSIIPRRTPLFNNFYICSSLTIGCGLVLNQARISAVYSSVQLLQYSPDH